MKFTLSLAKRTHQNVIMLPLKLQTLLTDLGLEVENFELINPSLMDMLVCEIKKIKQHPNADRLSLCQSYFRKKITM